MIIWYNVWMVNALNKQQTYQFLTYFGTVPFVLFSLVMALGNENTLGFIDVEFFFYSYSLAIVSFVCGTQWGTIIRNKDANLENILILSNVITLSAWIAASFNDKSYTLIFNSFCFLALLASDFYIWKKKLITSDYFKTRAIATSIVTFSTIMVLCSL